MADATAATATDELKTLETEGLGELAACADETVRRVLKRTSGSRTGGRCGASR